MAGRSIGGIFDLIATTDANMGFYYLLLHGWLWAGDSATWMRALSAIPALAAIPLTAILARRLFGDMVGLVAGFLMAGSMFVVANVQNARGYSLAMLLIVLAVMCFVAAVIDRRPGAWVACINHIVGIFREKNYAPGNTAILISDLGVPISLLVLLISTGAI